MVLVEGRGLGWMMLVVPFGLIIAFVRAIDWVFAQEIVSPWLVSVPLMLSGFLGLALGAHARWGQPRCRFEVTTGREHVRPFHSVMFVRAEHWGVLYLLLAGTAVVFFGN